MKMEWITKALVLFAALVILAVGFFIGVKTAVGQSAQEIVKPEPIVEESDVISIVEELDSIPKIYSWSIKKMSGEYTIFAHIEMSDSTMLIRSESKTIGKALSRLKKTVNEVLSNDERVGRATVQ